MIRVFVGAHGSNIECLGTIGSTELFYKDGWYPPLIVRGGGIKGGTAVIDGSVSSQFVSSLLISCIHADSRVTLRIKEEQVSKPYIHSTLATMETFGVKIDHDPNLLEYHVEKSKYRPTIFEIPGDFSTPDNAF